MRQAVHTTIIVPAEVHVVGALDVRSLSCVRSTFDHVMASSPERVVVDLAGCDFVDAAGVGLLVDMHRQVRSVGGQLTLRGGSSRLLRAMESATVHWQLQHTSASTGISNSMQTW